jgi:hypothetical protein
MSGMKNKRDTDAEKVIEQVWINKRRILGLSGGGGTGGQVVYDEVYATYAEILALDPTANLGKTMWATDGKIAFKAVTNTNVTPALDRWQAIGMVYDVATDTFRTPQNQSGQRQDIGREIFGLAVNNSVAAATELEPKLFLLTSPDVTYPEFENAVLIDAAGLSNGADYGLNTTAAGVGESMKVTRLGEINNVNTSAWGEGDTLYASEIAGELVNAQPLSNAYIVGKVRVSHATAGSISVNTLTALNILTNTEIFGGTPYYFTADVSPVDANTYQILINSKGTLSGTVTGVAGDNTTVPADKNFIVALGLTADSFISEGIYQGKLEVSCDNQQANERVYIEAYVSDAAGVPVDIAPLGVPGSLGINAITIYSSSVLNMSSNVIQDVTVSASVIADVPIVAGQNLLYVPLFEKIGAQGGDKTFTMLIGANTDSFIQGLGQSLSNLVPYQGASKDLDLGIHSVILRSPNGTRYKLVVDDTGVLTTTAVV